MEIVAYEDKFEAQVIALLKRNFAWMQTKSDEFMKDWLCQILNYAWLDTISPEVPYRRGMVLLDNEGAVAGFFGQIYAYRQIGGERRLCLNPTTWAIDEKHRFHIFSVFKTINDLAEVVVDFTPRDSVEQMAVKVFKYQYADQLAWKFLPVPCLKGGIRLQKADEHTISDPEVCRMYKDHIPYGVKCAKLSGSGEEAYIFYRVEKRKSRIGTFRWVYVLMTTDPALTAKFAHKIIWWLQTHECAAFLETDSRFFGGDACTCKPFRTSGVKRLVLNKTGADWNADLMYSEIVTITP